MFRSWPAKACPTAIATLKAPAHHIPALDRPRRRDPDLFLPLFLGQIRPARTSPTARMLDPSERTTNSPNEIFYIPRDDFGTRRERPLAHAKLGEPGRPIFRRSLAATAFLWAPLTARALVLLPLRQQFTGPARSARSRIAQGAAVAAMPPALAIGTSRL